jgi:HAD superfamily hydrolase (TIGR01509 family)
MSGRLPPGKVPWDLIAEHVTGPLGGDVRLGPAPGEDAALVTIGGELWAIASDPISFTAVDAGRLAVMVNANDVAVRGAQPRFFLATVLVAPVEASSERVEELLGQVRAACEQLGVALIGGHTEVTPELPHSLVIGTMLGPVKSRAITTGGLGCGDWIGMTRWAGLEGTAILLAELGERLNEATELDRLGLSEEWLSVVPEALLAAGHPAVTALHDVTEGGVGEALYELGRASGLSLAVDPEQIPMLPITHGICTKLGMSPYGLIGSGALLIGCQEAGKESLARAFAEQQIKLTWIGRAVAEGEATCGVPRFERDELLKAYLLAGTRAVIFDLDGTLVDSRYDWPAIRSQLEVDEGSIIDHLNHLPDPEREQKWAELNQIEDQASAAARPMQGADELLSLLHDRGIATALVTNNSGSNTSRMLERFGLAFDVVLTRDQGLWKPSGAPMSTVIEELGVSPEQCLAVGDSSFDLAAAREAGCGCFCAVYGAAERFPDQADLVFPDLRGLVRYLRIVLEA